MAAFRNTLRGLDLVLARYFEQFELAGIDCADRLQILMGFPRHEKERSLREHCGITRAIETWEVCLALEKARAKLSVTVAD